MKADPAELLKQGFALLGISFNPVLIDSFTRYRLELQKWGRVHNLTSNLTDEAIVTKHFLDSLVYLQGFPQAPVLKVADVGSGAGFPGLPIALVRTQDQFTLFEPRRKRASFLKHMVRVLGLGNVIIVGSRIEEQSPSGDGYDVIMTRALFNLSDLVSATNRLLNPGGRWILSAGQKPHVKAPRNGVQLEIRQTSLPLENVDRWLIILITTSVPRGTL